MIIYTKKDILTTDCKGIINLININGVIEKTNNSQGMKNRFPKNHQMYQNLKNNSKLKIGHVFYCEDRNIFTDQEKIIFNFPYKHDHTNSSQIEYISKGLKYFDYLMTLFSDEILPNIAMPSLKKEFTLEDYNKIRQLFNFHFEELNKVIVIHET